MRVLGVIILVIALALAGATYYFGMRAQSEYRQIVDITARSANIKVQKSEYERGLLSSNASTEYILSRNGGDLLLIRETDKIYHGPIPFGLVKEGKMEFRPVMAVIESTAELVSVNSPEFNEILSKMPPVNVYTVISIDGSGNSLISIPGVATMTGSGQEIENVTWKGLKGNVDFSSGFRNIKSDISSPGLELEGKNGFVSISGLKGSSDMVYPDNADETPVGKASAVIEEVTLRTKEERIGEIDNVSLKNIEFRGESVENGPTFDSVGGFHVNELTIEGNPYGPVEFEMAVRNIDKAAWLKFNEAMQEESARYGQTGTDAASQAFSALLPDFIKRSPEIEISKLRFTSGDGVLKGHAFIKIDGSSAAENPEMAANPLFLLMAASAGAELTVSKTLLVTILSGFDEDSRDEELNEMTVKALLEDNYIVEDGDNYRFEAAYEMGNITVNGEPLDMGSMLMNQ